MPLQATAASEVASAPQGFLLLGSALSELHSFRLAQSAFQAGMKLEGCAGQDGYCAVASPNTYVAWTPRSSEELLAAVNACAAGADNQAFQEFSEVCRRTAERLQHSCTGLSLRWLSPRFQPRTAKCALVCVASASLECERRSCPSGGAQ